MTALMQPVNGLPLPDAHNAVCLGRLNEFNSRHPPRRIEARTVNVMFQRFQWGWSVASVHGFHLNSTNVHIRNGQWLQASLTHAQTQHRLGTEWAGRHSTQCALYVFHQQRHARRRKHCTILDAATGRAGVSI